MNINPISAIANSAANIIGKFKMDPVERAKLQAQELSEQRKYADLAAKRAHEIQLKQLDINLADAGSGKIWQSGWRPYFGWVAGTGFAYQVLFFNLFDGFFGKWLTLHPLNEMQSQLLYYVTGILIGARGLEKGVSLYQRSQVKKEVVKQGGKSHEA